MKWENNKLYDDSGRFVGVCCEISGARYLFVSTRYFYPKKIARNLDKENLEIYGMMFSEIHADAEVLDTGISFDTLGTQRRIYLPVFRKKDHIIVGNAIVPAEYLDAIMSPLFPGNLFLFFPKFLLVETEVKYKPNGGFCVTFAFPGSGHYSAFFSGEKIFIGYAGNWYEVVDTGIPVVNMVYERINNVVEIRFPLEETWLEK